MKISLLVAMAENRVIGRNNDLPWHLPKDLKRFKALTVGHTIIMGRRTFESIGRPLPKRRSVVVSRNPNWHFAGVETASSLDAALATATGEPEVFVVGGAAIYGLALPLAHRLYITRVHAQVEGDIFFPDFDLRKWRLVEDEAHQADERHAYAYSFQLYTRADS